MSRNRLSEHDLQRSCVNWFRYQYPYLRHLLFAVPNGGYRNAREAPRLKEEGVSPGVADLILLLPSGEFNTLNIEMKVGRNNQSEHQLLYERFCTTAGNQYIVCRSAEEFKSTVSAYIAATPSSVISALKSCYAQIMEENIQQERARIQVLVNRSNKNNCNTTQIRKSNE